MNRWLRELTGALIVPTLLAGRAWPTDLQDRMAKEAQWRESGLFVLPHRPNYLMPLSYNGRPNTAPFPPGTPLQEVETKFQFSIKVPLLDHLFTYDIRSYLAYTQVSYWQTYNKEKSSFFRNTDYEPEFFLQWDTSRTFGPLTNRINRLGFDHQSNGQADPSSRSWNRLYAEFIFDTAHSMIAIKPWYRLAGPPTQDSEPDMWKYLGYGELRGALKLKRHELSLLFRNNLRLPDNKGAIELGWAFPLIRSIKGFVQYFNGYGDSLLDYNYPVSRVSVGVSFSDWL